MNDDSDVSEYVDDSDRKPVSRNTKPKAAKTGKSRSRNANVKREALRGSSIEQENQPDQNGSSNATRKIKSDTLRAYRDLLNSNIAEVLEPADSSSLDSLPPSQVGTSFWTANEKHRLFAAIQSHGPGELSALAVAVGTKAEPEIKAYILLLQEGVRELDTKATQQFGPADVPAAIETKLELLEAEETLAAALEERARAVEETREKQVWGEESWLIDEDAAAAIEERYGEPDARTSRAIDAEQDRREATRSTSDERQSDSSSPSSVELLKAATFLQLSRSLFMNSTNPEMNWRTFSQDEESDHRLSIRRTAFDDFHNLAVSLTRRLMQASIFQALSRLRASSDTRLLPHVNGFDVAAARETMGLKTQRPDYWADAVKRCGVEVYSESKKWRTQEGRQGTKNGVKLTDAELRAELGALLPDSAAPMNEVSDTEEDAESSDSDAYTVASSSGDSDGELSDAEVVTDARGRILKDRRRALSPASFHRAETRYFERVDRYNMADLDNDYRDILGLPATANKYTNKPGFPYKQADMELRPADWRAAVHYEAPWEQPHGMPQKRDFDIMEMDGARRRKRRRLTVETDNAPETDQGEEPLVGSSDVNNDEDAESNPASAESGSEDDEESDQSDANSQKDASSGSEAE